MRHVACLMGVVVLLGTLRAEAAEPAAEAPSVATPAPTPSPEPVGQVFVDAGYPLFYVAMRSPRPALGLEYEHALSRLVSLHLTLRASLSSDPDRNYFPVLVTPGVRVYPFAQQALTGFWLNPELSLMQLTFISDGRVSPSPAVIPGLGVGYTLSPIEHLALSFGVTSQLWLGGGALVTFAPRIALGYRF